MDVIIEIISRSRRVLERYHFTGHSVSIGRAYDNDLIISDPHISPHHAIIRDTGESGWRIEDLNSKNGIFTHRHQRIHTSETIHSGDELILGKTHLRIFDRLHKVADALSMNPVEKVIQPLNRSSNAIMFVIFALVIFGLDSYLDLYVDFEFRHIFTDTMGMMLVATGWALIWALIGRVMRHDARFLVQLVITLAYLLSELVFSNSLDLLAFNSSTNTGAFVLGTIGHFILFSLLLWLNLYIAISQTDRKRLLMSFGISSSVVALVLLYYFLNLPEFSGFPQYVNSLKPPAVQWLHPVTTETFLREADEVFVDARADTID